VIQTKGDVTMSNFVILPLYSTKYGQKICFSKSSINQSNAAGRDRNPYEVYIPIPVEIRNLFPNFFPENSFILKTENGNESFNVKTCQEYHKALMSNPNSHLGKWIFNQLGLTKYSPSDIINYEQLATTGYDSVKIENANGDYYISLMPVGSYESFIKNKSH
jgi:restriction endonuclease